MDLGDPFAIFSIKATTSNNTLNKNKQLHCDKNLESEISPFKLTNTTEQMNSDNKLVPLTLTEIVSNTNEELRSASPTPIPQDHNKNINTRPNQIDSESESNFTKQLAHNIARQRTGKTIKLKKLRKNSLARRKLHAQHHLKQDFHVGQNKTCTPEMGETTKIIPRVPVPSSKTKVIRLSQRILRKMKIPTITLASSLCSCMVLQQLLVTTNPSAFLTSMIYSTLTSLLT